MSSLWCPCPSPWGFTMGGNPPEFANNEPDGYGATLLGAYNSRRLDEAEESASDGKTWEMVYVGIVLCFMFAALLSDRIGADMVMLAALTACMAAEIITVDEGVSGFSNEGVLTVVVLFVVASGIQMTGGLDWYMSKLLGRPSNIPSAQLRLMGPIALVSAFLNNTPVVVVMIPIVQKWGKNIGISPAQLLVPLSFASILGGTCTLIGTSTNLVVSGLLQSRYPNDSSMVIGLFDLAEFGIPVALIGITYIIIASPYLLPGGKKSSRKDDSVPLDDGTILLGARLTKWSPAANRSIKRSGLRDTGGIYLVSVYRTATGNVHRAVGQEFILNVDDILYFTGMVEEFGQFCEHHGLEVVTNENEADKRQSHAEEKSSSNDFLNTAQYEEDLDEGAKVVKFASTIQTTIADTENEEQLPLTIETVMPSPLRGSTHNAEGEKVRAINRMRDMIRGYDPSEPFGEEVNPTPKETILDGSAKVVVVLDTTDLQDMVLVGINANDRPGLLLDISRGLHSLGLQLHHTEAAVIQNRSVSIWRCEVRNNAHSDSDEIWSVLSALLEKEGSVEAIKRGGLSVIRTIVTEQSRLCGKVLEEVPFRELYKAAVIAVQKFDKSEVDDLPLVIIAPGDILVLQASEDSPLLVHPPPGFYSQLLPRKQSKLFLTGTKSPMLQAVTKRLTKGMAPDGSPDSPPQSSDEHNNSSDIENAVAPDSNHKKEDGVNQSIHSTRDEEVISDEKQEFREAWRDLRVLFSGNGDSGKSQQDVGSGSREYLAAMVISPKSPHAKKTIAVAGLDKLSGLFLVQVERLVTENAANRSCIPNSGAVNRVIYTSAAAINSSSPNIGGRSNVNAVARVDGNTSLMGRIGFFGGGSEAGSSQGPSPPPSMSVPPEDPLEEGDILWYAGPASAIADLRKIPGLVSFEDDELKQINEKVHDRRLVQAVIARKGPLVGKTAVEVGFRTRYGAAVIAVHRDGTRVQNHPGNIKLQAGDVLLLEAGPTFISRNTDNQHSFALISEVADSKPPRLDKLIPAVVLVVAMLAVVTAGVSSLLVCGLITAMIMVCTGILSQQEARDSVSWDVYVTIACAFGIGIALTNSGLAQVIATGLVWVGEALGIGDAGLYGAVYLATFLISNVVTNNAAAALMFPIAMEAAEETGADPLLMAYDLMLAASASFMSPFGYTTNLLIYGPGGYKVKDFLYIGTPMQFVLWILTTAILSNTTTPWYFSWIVTSAVFVLALLIFVFPAFVKDTLGKARDAAQQVPGIDHTHSS